VHDGSEARVSFATTSNFHDEDDDDNGNGNDMPTIFVLGPMMCSRYFLLGFDHLACRMGVRVVFMDR